MSDALRPKALSVLRSGRLTMITSANTGPEHRVCLVEAKVQSSREGGPTYAVDFAFDRWACTCTGWLHRGECAHIAAVQLVTGHATAELRGVA